MTARNIERVAQEINVPRPVVAAFAHLDPLALGAACGIVLGLWAFLATAILLMRGGSVIGPNLSLLSQYFIGFKVTWIGALIGLTYGLVCGFVFGFGFGVLRNAFTRFYLEGLHKKIREEAFSDLP